MSDIYRDLILTGVLISLLTAVYRLGGWNAIVESGLKELSEKMAAHYQENKESHERIYKVVEEIDSKLNGHSERIAKVETNVENLCSPKNDGN